MGICEVGELVRLLRNSNYVNQQMVIQVTMFTDVEVTALVFIIGSCLNGYYTGLFAKINNIFF